MPEEDLDALIKLTKEIDGVRRVQLYGRIGQMSVDFEAPKRTNVLDALCEINAEKIADAKTGYSVQFEPRTHALFMNLAVLIGARYARKWFLPAPIRAMCTVVSFLPFLRTALFELSRSRLTVPVLD
ncbi:MAG: heavy metal translocating P-type ATPase, partial [Slackia isoflavoniconvertens]|nr:heavy metal translocating P-type ATPase [Slackia isoflavoniconvertens]